MTAENRYGHVFFDEVVYEGGGGVQVNSTFSMACAALDASKPSPS